MTNPPKKQRGTVVDVSGLELDPDAWPKFEKLIRSAAKMGHKPHTPTKPKKKRRKPA